MMTTAIIAIFISAISLMLSWRQYYFTHVHKVLHVTVVPLPKVANEQRAMHYAVVNQGTHNVIITDARYYISSNMRDKEWDNAHAPDQECDDVPQLLPPGDIAIISIRAQVIKPSDISTNIMYNLFSLISSDGNKHTIKHDLEYSGQDETLSYYNILPKLSIGPTKLN